MASLLRMFKRTLKRGTNVVRSVGRATRRTVKRGTNAVGLTRRRRGRKSSRNHRKQ